jgi:peptide/nickel transport system permease protein
MRYCSRLIRDCALAPPDVRRISALLLSAMVLLAVFAPLLAPYEAATQLDIVALKNQAPSVSHLLGTDAYSRDILSRVLFGARTSLFVAVVATMLAIAAGVLWGGLAASAANRIGEAMMLVVDVFRSVPRLLLFLFAVALAGALSPLPLAMVLGISAWPAMGRLVYSLVRDAQSRAFVEAARAAGVAPVRVFLHHIVPHLMGPLGAAGTLLLADVLALEAGLSFLGLGIRPPGASWGNMVQDALPYLGSAWWTAAVPCVCLLVTVLSASQLADHLQKKTRRHETIVPRA